MMHCKQCHKFVLRSMLIWFQKGMQASPCFLPNSVSPSWNCESWRTRPLIPCAFRFPHCPAEFEPEFLKLSKFWSWRGGLFCWAVNWLTLLAEENWFPVTMLVDDAAPLSCWLLWPRPAPCESLLSCCWVRGGAGKNEENPSVPWNTLQNVKNV